jgi:hypothetical protein
MKIDIAPDELSDAASVRDYIIDSLRRELVGPDPGHPFVQWDPLDRDLAGQEVLRPQDPPRFRYACGMLFPNGVRYSGSEAPSSSEEAETLDAFTQPIEVDDAAGGADDSDDESGAGPEEESERSSERDADPDVDQTSLFLPSTMGISFLIVGEGPVSVQADWATYVATDFPHYASGDGRRHQAGKVWLRRPATIVLEITHAELTAGTIAVFRRRLSREGQTPILELDVVSRQWRDGQHRGRLVTLTLMNTTPGGGDANQNCLFQCGLRARPGQGLTFERYPEADESTVDPEGMKLKLLYRHRPIHAVGHGCAADWITITGGRVVEVHTEVLPVFKQAPIVPRDFAPGAEAADADGPALSMRRIAEGDRSSILRQTRQLAGQYRAWISAREAEARADASLTEGLRRAATENPDACAGVCTGSRRELSSWSMMISCWTFSSR